ncbi:HAD-IA family hydrolase [Poseidonocella sp. HB161398]|uniref:HAD-IA family hydrolase n=1 Tax=Poseidonocella sp. HB161398 TaxID=2320855 RepID=UPI001108E350|nr:HAD-IA family hydrolase [Poseidonocella sp. HB161398]
MSASRLIRWVEKRLFDRRAESVVSALPGSLGRDDNNIFSLHELEGYADIDVVSFDFFDTLFFREHLCMEQVFAKTAQLGASLVDAPRDEVFRALVAARGYGSFQLKRQMQARGDGDEPALSAIFERALVPFLDDPEERARIAARLVELETGIELRNLVPNREAAAVLRNLKLLGRKVIVVSDMYLPAASLARVLEASGLAEHVDDLVVSSEYGITKNSGELFEVVAKRCGVPRKRVLHVGDNWINDCIRPRERGFRSVHYYNHDQENVVRLAQGMHGLPRPGTVRKDELRRDFDLAARKPLASLDAVVGQVIAPAAALFVHDVLQRALRKRSSHVFFLTRDGTIFREIAEAMVAAAPELYPLEAKFCTLATSRATGALLGFSPEDSDYLYITTEYLSEVTFSFARFRRIFGITDEEFHALPEATRSHIDWLGDGMGIDGFRDLYWDYDDFRRLVQSAAHRKTALTMDYLEQEGLFEARNPLLVDIGYSGTWGKQISPALEKRERLGDPVPAEIGFEFFATNRFYVGNVQRMHPAITMGPGRILDHRRTDLALTCLNYAWLEPFFLDPTLGKLDGFVREGGRIRAEFRDPAFSMAEKARIEGLRHALVGRCAQFAADLMRKEGTVEELRRLVQDRLVDLVAFPKRSEVAAVNSLAHERGMETVKAQEIAPHFYPNNFRAKIDYLMMNDHWVQGSLSRSGMGLANRALAWYFARTRADFEDWKP